MRAGAAAGPGRSSPDAQREVCDGLTPIHLASWARENTFARNRIRCSDKGSSAATRAVRAAPTTVLVGVLCTGVLTAAFFEALLATAVFFAAITTLYPIFFVGCDATTATGRALTHEMGPIGEYAGPEYAGLSVKPPGWRGGCTCRSPWLPRIWTRNAWKRCEQAGRGETRSVSCDGSIRTAVDGGSALTRGQR
jgi:hypothetical protein